MKQGIPAKVVTIGEDGPFCVIEPACAELSNVFFTVRHNPEPDIAHGNRVVRRPYPLVWPGKDIAGQSQSICYAGIAPLIRQKLRQLGYTIHSVAQPCELWPEPASSPWNLAESVDAALLSLVQHHRRGFVYYHSQNVQLVRLLAQVARAWPRVSIVVPVTRPADAWRLRAGIAQFIPAGQVGVYTGNATADGHKRIVIGTYRQLGQGSVALHDRQLMLLPNPCEMLANDDGRQVFAKSRSARCFGFLPTAAKVTLYHCDLLRALFGDRRLTIPTHGKTHRHVNVYFTQTFGGQKLPKDLNQCELKRRGISECSVRNRRIAALAQLVARKDTHGIAIKFPDIVSGVQRLAKARIGILTENVDHALELGSKLPDWPILAGDSMALDGLTPVDIQRLEQGSALGRRSPRLIVTMAGLARAGRLDIVIRADGGTGLPELDMGVTTYENGRPQTLVIFDFEDLHHRQLRRRSEQRREAYRDAGWRLPQYPQSELELFLSRRPKVQWT